MQRTPAKPRINTRVYVRDGGDSGVVKGHYFQYTMDGNRLHSVLVLLDNAEYGTYSPSELTDDIHCVITALKTPEEALEISVEKTEAPEAASDTSAILGENSGLRV